MTKILCAGLAAASICTALPRPAEAWGGGGGFAVGTIFGLGVGAVVGSALTRPYYYPPYGYPAYGYYPYAVPYAYAYPPPVYAVPPVAYAPPSYPVAPPPVAQAPVPSAARTVACRPGQFFNTLTGNCDRR